MIYQLLSFTSARKRYKNKSPRQKTNTFDNTSGLSCELSIGFLFYRVKLSKFVRDFCVFLWNIAF